MLAIRKRPSLSDLTELSWFPFLEPPLRIEEFRKDDTYVVRAEVPGVNPAKDVDVHASKGVLRIVVVRTEESKQDGHSEFRYGTLHRTVTLPEGAKDETIKASYTDGILEVTMKIGEPLPSGRAIPVAISNGSPKLVKKD